MKGKLIVTGYRDITAAELKAKLKNKDFFLLDVHIPEQKHIEGTDAFIPYNEIEKYVDRLPKDKDTKIVVYCRTGSMSAEASRTLLRLGYKNVYNLLGGIKAWEWERHCYATQLRPQEKLIKKVLFYDFKKKKKSHMGMMQMRGSSGGHKAKEDVEK